VLEKSGPAFERTIGARLELHFDATQAILPRLAAGFRADLVILTAEAIEELRKARRVTQVRALKRTLVSASSVAHSKVGASGIYFVELLQRLGIADRVKTRVVERGPVGLVVAAGEAELGVQQLCELEPVPGIEIVGPLPEPVQRYTHFSAGIPANAANPKGASALMTLLQL
jgi:molybdate transport system substrate-binding protein